MRRSTGPSETTCSSSSHARKYISRVKVFIDRPSSNHVRPRRVGRRARLQGREGRPPTEDMHLLRRPHAAFRRGGLGHVRLACFLPKVPDPGPMGPHGNTRVCGEASPLTRTFVRVGCSAVPETLLAPLWDALPVRWGWILGELASGDGFGTVGAVEEVRGVSSHTDLDCHAIPVRMAGPLLPDHDLHTFVCLRTRLNGDRSRWCEHVAFVVKRATGRQQSDDSIRA
jgi:hypothetical protein